MSRWSFLIFNFLTWCCCSFIIFLIFLIQCFSISTSIMLLPLPWHRIFPLFSPRRSMMNGVRFFNIFMECEGNGFFKPRLCSLSSFNSRNDRQNISPDHNCYDKRVMRDSATSFLNLLGHDKCAVFAFFITRARSSWKVNSAETTAHCSDTETGFTAIKVEWQAKFTEKAQTTRVCDEFSNSQ